MWDVRITIVMGNDPADGLRRLRIEPWPATERHASTLCSCFYGQIDEKPFLRVASARLRRPLLVTHCATPSNPNASSRRPKPSNATRNYHTPKERTYPSNLNTCSDSHPDKSATPGCLCLLGSGTPMGRVRRGAKVIVDLGRICGEGARDKG